MKAPDPVDNIFPVGSTVITGMPTFPSESESTKPASLTSEQLSLSESVSILFGTPSLSVSRVSPPSAVSSIPSLSSSTSSSSGTPSSSVSVLNTESLAALEVTSWSHLNAFVCMSSLYWKPSIDASTESIFSVVVVSSE